jgi:hypothetical protein
MKITTLVAAIALVAFAGNVNAKTISLSSLSTKQIANLKYLQDRLGTNHILITVAFCESSLEHTESNGSVKLGDVDPRDTGLMQINKGYHLRDAQRMGLNLDSRDDNVTYAKHLFKTQGKQPWSASFPCMSTTRLPVVS